MRDIKLIVWDLDGTMWDGVWIEEGENVEWKPGIERVIERLDGMGILQSIASRNVAEDEALLKFLEDKGIMKYMLYPQIIHQPKSFSLNLIKNALGLSRWDEIAFVDDREFERAEVAHQYPDVLLLNANHYLHFPDRESIYRKSVTDTDRRRRELCQTDQVRQQEAEVYDGDYQGYLKTLEMKAVIRPMVEDDIDRVHQIMVRTNRFNAAVSIWTTEELRSTISNNCPNHATVWLMTLKDRLGDYGIIGFKIVYSTKNSFSIVSMALSCRVAGRGLGSSLVIDTMKEANEQGKGVEARYRETPHNSKMSSLYDFLGFTEVPCDGIREDNPFRVFLWDHTESVPTHADWLDVIVE